MTENLTQKKQYPLVDILKFAMAILVIILHRKIFPVEMKYANFMMSTVFCHIAVPFFFMVSSFLFFRNVDVNSENAGKSLWKTEKRLIILYVIWSVIYLPFNFVKSFTGHYDEISFGGLAGQLVTWIKDFALNYSFLHLWYINTLAFTLLVIFLLMKKFSPVKVTVFSTLVAPVSLFLVEFLNLRDYLPNVIIQTFVVGACCVSLGALAAKCDISLFLKHKWIFLGVSIISLFVSGTIRYHFSSDLTFAITQFLTYIVAFFVFLIAISSEMKPFRQSKSFRNYSTLMYFCHLMLMKEGFNFIALHTGIQTIATGTTLQFAATLIFAVAFSFIIINLSKVRMFRWLKWLY